MPSGIHNGRRIKPGHFGELFPGLSLTDEESAWLRFTEIKKRQEGVTFPRQRDWLRWAKLFMDVWPRMREERRAMGTP